MTTHRTIALNTHREAKWSFGKTLLILCGICSAYAWLIPTQVLTENPGLLPFVNVMESILPAIKGFARASPVPEVVRFYYATMWILFPIVYLFVRVRWINTSIKFESSYSNWKALIAVFFFTGLIVLLLRIMGFYEIPEIPIKQVLTGGRGNALFAALVIHPVSIGVTSVLCWMIIAFLVEFNGHCIKRILIRR